MNQPVNGQDPFPAEKTIPCVGVAETHWESIEESIVHRKTEIIDFERFMKIFTYDFFQITAHKALKISYYRFPMDYAFLDRFSMGFLQRVGTATGIPLDCLGHLHLTFIHYLWKKHCLHGYLSFTIYVAYYQRISIPYPMGATPRRIRLQFEIYEGRIISTQSQRSISRLKQKPVMMMMMMTIMLSHNSKSHGQHIPT